MSQGIIVRKCESLDEFHRCVDLQREIWGEADLEVEPATMFVVAAHTGGQVLGAFDGDRLVGYTLAVVGLRDRVTYLHSHMTGVRSEYRDRGVGRMLKLFQRSEALGRGSSQRALQSEPAWRHLPGISTQFVWRDNEPPSPQHGDRPAAGGMASRFRTRRGGDRKSRQRSCRGTCSHRGAGRT